MRGQVRTDRNRGKRKDKMGNRKAPNLSIHQGLCTSKGLSKNEIKQAQGDQETQNGRLVPIHSPKHQSKGRDSKYISASDPNSKFPKQRVSRVTISLSQ